MAFERLYRNTLTRVFLRYRFGGLIFGGVIFRILRYLPSFLYCCTVNLSRHNYFLHWRIKIYYKFYGIYLLSCCTVNLSRHNYFLHWWIKIYYKFISSSCRVMFFLLYGQKKDIDKIIDVYSPMQKEIVTAQIYSTAI